MTKKISFENLENKVIFFLLFLMVFLIGLLMFQRGNTMGGQLKAAGANAIINLSPIGTTALKPEPIVSGRIFLLAGYQGNNITTTGIVDYSDVWSSPDGANWSLSVQSAPWGKREGQATLYFKKKLWVISGQADVKGYTTPEKNDVWSSSDGKNWKKEVSSAPWKGRKQFGATVFNNEMWIYGGVGTNTVTGEQTFFDDMWKSSDGVNWTSVPNDLPAMAMRYDFQMVSFDKKIWILGGASPDSGVFFNDVWSSIDGINWVQATHSAPWSTRQGLSSVVFGGKIWVIGGWNDTYGYLNDVWSSADGINWVQSTSAPWVGRSASQVIVFDGKMWILGGGYDYGLHYTLNDVWSSSDGNYWTQAVINAPWLFREYHSVIVAPEIKSEGTGQVKVVN